MNIAIYGLGLIGGSIGRATIKNTQHKVYGADLSKESIQKALLVGAIHAELDEAILKECDLVILALYPDGAISVMQQILPLLKDGAVLIDCCGTKRDIVDAMDKAQQEYPNVNFVATHPMAGREFSGISHATANLFENAYTIITPVHSNMQSLMLVKEFFLSLGCAGIEVADAQKHDKLISYTSQLAHVVSNCYIKNPLSQCYTGFSAGSFRDMTRVAKINAGMWTQLFLQNRDMLIEQIEVFQKNMQDVKDALESGDEKRLYDLLEEGNQCKLKADELMKERRKNDKNSN